MIADKTTKKGGKMTKYIQSFGDYSVKKVKSFMGREGCGFNCDLYRKNKKVASCIDDASGGEMYLYWTTDIEKEQKLLNKFLATIPPVSLGFMEGKALSPVKVDKDLFIEELVNQWEREKDIKKMQRQCRTKTLFRLKGDTKGSYHILNAPHNEQTRQYLLRRHGKKVTEVFNVVLENGKVPSVLED